MPRTRAGAGARTAVLATARAAALATVLLTGACGVGASGVEDGGEAPTGLAPGPTLYFVDSDGELQPDVWDGSRRLGTVQGAIQLLFADVVPTGPPGTNLRNEIPQSTTRTVVEDAGDYVTIYVPFPTKELSHAAVDQIICTTAAVVAASGRDVADVTISVRPTHGPVATRPCKALD